MFLTFAQVDLAVGEVDQAPGLLPPLGFEEIVEVEGHVFGTRATRRVDLGKLVMITHRMSPKWLRECIVNYNCFLL